MAEPISRRRRQGEAARSQPATAPSDPVAPCASCQITISPDPLQLCDTSTRQRVTATATPSGGSYSWQVDDTGIATLSGSGNRVRVQGVKEGATKVRVTYQQGAVSCSDEIDAQVCTCTQGRKYAYGLKTVARVIGVRAKIKTRYGKLCCEGKPCGTQAAYFGAYVNISDESGTLYWGQSGFGRERNAGSTTINRDRYAEMQGATYRVFKDRTTPPAEGSRHTYQAEVDPRTGRWTFSYDGSAWQTFADRRWRNRRGTSVQYTGEILNEEDDMPGTSSDKCAFTECQYLVEPANRSVEEATPSVVLDNFGYDDSRVTAQHQVEIDRLADRVVASQGTPPPIAGLRFVGHTDPVGSEGYNIGCGQRRANAVRRAFTTALDHRQPGLSGQLRRLAESKGESELVDNSGTDAGNSRNRRVEVFVTTEVPLRYQDAGLVAGDVSSDDASEWGAEWISGTALNIWDKKPLA